MYAESLPFEFLFLLRHLDGSFTSIPFRMQNKIYPGHDSFSVAYLLSGEKIDADTMEECAMMSSMRYPGTPMYVYRNHGGIGFPVSWTEYVYGLGCTSGFFTTSLDFEMDMELVLGR